MADSGLAGRIDAVRRFNRFYTRKIGVLEERLLRSPFSLAEARIVYELGQRATATATELARELSLDAGYLSRLLGGLEERGIVVRAPSPSDGRQSLLSLTAAGRQAFAALDARSAAQIGA
ncbi:MAG TPA: MarR family transcriptional regulator, partial [Stellaceae bacterium]|nr:MarR family transcriptional regulator [Stellaceae bacterium]